MLVRSDDGYEAAGIWAMQRALIETGYTVTMVAPKRQQSWSGKSLFDHSPITHKTITVKDQLVHVLDATPAACTRIGLHNILENPPLFVVSGVNHGGNDGIHYMMSSGTLGAALEASFDGIRSLAVSLAHALNYRADDSNVNNAFAQAASVAADLIKKLEHYTFPPDIDALNINVPYDIKDRTIAVCKHNRDRNVTGQLKMLIHIIYTQKAARP